MGTPPLLGRALTQRDENPAEPPVVVISHAVWKSRFTSDPAVVGKIVKLGTTSATIVGVMPEGFGFPVNHRLWTPLRVDGPRAPGPVRADGVRAPGPQPIDDARTEIGVIGARLAAANPETHKHLRFMVTNYAKPIDSGQMLLIRNIVYSVNVVFLLLLAIVCTNVATLVFARTATRGWEITVRSALGASRGRIISQLFIEALVLASLAAILGLGVARLGLGYGVGQFAASGVLPFWIDASLSWKTVLYTVLLTLIGAVIVGVLPALRVTRINVHDALRNEAAARSGLKFGGFWTGVIVVQVAITVAFLPLAAGGAFESNRFNQRAEGIGAERYLTAGVGIDREDYVMDSAAFTAHTRRAFEALESRLREEPSVEAVAFSDRLPVEDQFKYTIEVDSMGGVPAGIRTRRS
jgi:cell division protein FtsX